METIILFAPIVGAVICGFGWRLIGEQAAQWVATGLLFIACLLSWMIFIGHDGITHKVLLARFIESGTLNTDWAIRMDRLTATMLIVITTVSALVHLYSFGYMADDKNFNCAESYRPRFFAYLSFFTFAMLVLVTSDNLVQMFVGWEGVGVASYLLIGFYFRKPSANAAAIKAFVVNRVGDFGFLLGIFALFFLTDSISLDVIFERAPELALLEVKFLSVTCTAADICAILLFVGAMGKSAQIFLHTWLPDAMEGPTPVSALIHAATMVTAGVYLICRMSPLVEFATGAANIIVIIGATTAFFAATVGLVQNDIKRVIAFSTCSQIGYMFVAAGVGAYSVAMFHLFTHAFFKAMLFLGAGSVIHSMHHEQDMRNYGGLRDKIPYTFWAMLLGTFAITGVGIPLTYIGFAGFLSKDAIIESAWAVESSVGTFAFWLLVVSAMFTSFYSWRLMFLTFFGTARGSKRAHDDAKESPRIMLVPLGILALGAIFSGMLWVKPFFGDQSDVSSFFGIPRFQFESSSLTTQNAPNILIGGSSDEGIVKRDDVVGWTPGSGAIYFHPSNHVLDAAHHVPKWIKISPFLAMLLGFGVAWLFYIRRPDLPGLLAENQRHLYLFLLNRWYFDESYDFVFVRSAKSLGAKLWRLGDSRIIDGGINALAISLVPFVARVANRFQSGYIFKYAFVMVVGIVLLVTWMSLAVG